MSDININSLLSQLRQTAAVAQGNIEPVNNQPASAYFSGVLKSAIETVNETQQKSGELKAAFEMGDRSVGLTQVMIASQKANVSFQAMLQVRNKLVAAYQDVMSMQI